MEVSGRANRVSLSKTDDWDQDEKILQPYTHILKTSTKGFRAKLFKALNYWLKFPADKLSEIQEVFQMYHLCCLLIDDIQDNSALRRGSPAAHTVYGVASTISTAMFLYFKSMQMVLSFNHPDCIKLYTEMLLELTRGQAIEISWRDNHTCPSEEEYLDMVKGKTAATFIVGMPMMQLISENKADFTKLMVALGRYVQIRNDYCDLGLQECSEKKAYGDDIMTGAFSFPIIHAVKSHPNDHQVSSILRQRTKDVELKKYCVTLLEKFGSVKYTRLTLEMLDAEMRAEIAKLGGNPMLEDVLDELFDWKRGTC